MGSRYVDQSVDWNGVIPAMSFPEGPRSTMKIEDLHVPLATPWYANRAR
jgi:hypothetical protein